MRFITAAALIAASIFSATVPANAASNATVTLEAAAALTRNQFVWADNGANDPVSVVVSLPDQRAYVYRGQTLIAMSSVSTGKDGKDTPVGVYPILQKKAMHKSNLYDSAPMPYMQRLTWDGIALHAGRNPGFPDSHGCIRMPIAFAKKLFAVTDVGTDVTVIDSGVTDDKDSLVPYEVAEQAQTEVARANTTQLEEMPKAQ